MLDAHGPRRVRLQSDDESGVKKRLRFSLRGVARNEWCGEEPEHAEGELDPVDRPVADHRIWFRTA